MIVLMSEVFLGGTMVANDSSQHIVCQAADTLNDDIITEVLCDSFSDLKEQAAAAGVSVLEYMFPDHTKMVSGDGKTISYYGNELLQTFVIVG